MSLFNGLRHLLRAAASIGRRKFQKRAKRAGSAGPDASEAAKRRFHFLPFSSISFRESRFINWLREAPGRKNFCPLLLKSAKPEREERAARRKLKKRHAPVLPGGRDEAPSESLRSAGDKNETGTIAQTPPSVKLLSKTLSAAPRPALPPSAAAPGQDIHHQEHEEGTKRREAGLRAFFVYLVVKISGRRLLEVRRRADHHQRGAPFSS